MADWHGTLPAFAAGEELPAPDLQTLADVANAETAAWSAYTGTWGSLGTQPALGNGTLVSRYRRVGKTVNVYIVLTMGSTSTFGTNVYTFLLPTAAIQADIIGAAHFLDSSAASRKSGVSITLSTDLTKIFMAAEAGTVTSAVPWTWATADQILVNITYETS